MIGIGETVAHYRILEKLGAGGMGEVYKAEDLTLGRTVALKFLPAALSDDRQAVERLRREARAASILNHPGICTIHAIEEHEGQQFIAMELLDGRPMSEILVAPMPMSTLLTYAVQLADALDAAHSRNLIHRDIKPGNIFITRRGQAKLVDFGLVKQTGGSQPDSDGVTVAHEVLSTTPGLAVGTVAYMSPEQARGEELDARTDLFSFALVIYEMATGRRAFGGSSTAVIFDAILNRMPPPAMQVNPSVPFELDRILSKALEKDPRFRYQTALDLGADLQRLKRDAESGRVPSYSGATPYAAAPGPASAGYAPGPYGSTPVVVPPSSGMAGFGAPPSGAPPVSVQGPPTAPGSIAPVQPLSAASPQPPASTAPLPPARSSGLSKGMLIVGGAVIVSVIALAAYQSGRGSQKSNEAPTVAGAGVAPVSPPTPDVPPAATVAAPVQPGSTPPAAPPPPAAPGAPTPPGASASKGAVPPPGAAGATGAADATGATIPLTPTAALAKAEAAATAKAKAANDERVKAEADAEAAKAAADAAVKGELQAARAKVDAGQYDQGIADLRAFIQKYPGSPATAGAYMLLGQAFDAANRPEEAMGAYQELHDRFKTHEKAPEALFRLGQRVLRSRRPNKEAAAQKIYTQLAEEYPASEWSARAMTARAILEEREREKVADQIAGGPVPKALLTYRAIAERYPSQAEDALWKLGAMYEDLNRHALAAQSLVDLTTRFPETKYDVWFRLAELYEKRLRDKPKAAEAYAKVPTTSPKYSDAQKKVRQLASER